MIKKLIITAKILLALGVILSLIIFTISFHVNNIASSVFWGILLIANLIVLMEAVRNEK